MRRFRYSAYGLRIASDIPLPDLPPGEPGTDVVVRLGEIRNFPRLSCGKAPGVFFSGEESFVRWKGVGSFRVNEGRSVTVDPHPRVPKEVLPQVLMRFVFGAVLHQRGRLLLHASAVVSVGGAVLFLGARGWGKSTLAAFLSSNGFDLITDDVVAVDARGPRPLVARSYPQMRLWPDALAFLGRPPGAFRKVLPRLEKRIVPPVSFSKDDFMPVRRVYVLSKGRSVEVRTIGASEAAIELVRHSYGGRWFQKADPAAHFSRCAALAGAVPFRRLVRPWDLGRLEQVRAAVREDLAA